MTTLSLCGAGATTQITDIQPRLDAAGPGSTFAAPTAADCTDFFRRAERAILTWLAESGMTGRWIDVRVWCHGDSGRPYSVDFGYGTPGGARKWASAGTHEKALVRVEG